MALVVCGLHGSRVLTKRRKTWFLTSNVEFIARSSHVTVVAVPTAGVSDLSVVNAQAMFHDGIATVRVVRKLSVDIHVRGTSVSRDTSPVDFTGLCRVTAHQYRLTLLCRDVMIIILCCSNTTKRHNMSATSLAINWLLSDWTTK